jgi:hypothetical protein
VIIAAALAAGLVLAPAPAGAVATPTAASAALPAECTHCHSCAQPTPAEPCLRGCPRGELSSALSADLGPDVVILDTLEDLYVPVRFDHRRHAVMAAMSGGCSTCHHYTPPSAPHPACSSCHSSASASEDIAKPGLKGAYHRRCLSCHREWDRDTACGICHLERKGGRLGGTATTACDHAHYRPVELKEVILFPTEYGPGDVVPFHHRRHSETYERDCTECHQRQSCTRCHLRDGVTPRPMHGATAASLHDTCFACHDAERCGDCHGRDRDAVFSHADAGWPLKRYHAALPCRSCHALAGAFRRLDTRCPACHAAGFDAARFDHAVTGVTLDETHREADCDACHTGGLGSPARCDACHDDGRTYQTTRTLTVTKP